MLTLPHRQRLPEIMDQPDLRPRGTSGRCAGWPASTSGAVAPAFCGGRSPPSPVGWAGRSASWTRPVGPATCRCGSGATPVGPASISASTAATCSAVAVEHARGRAAAAGADVRFFVEDVLRRPALSGYDVVMCSLFLHHLGEEEAAGFLRWAAATAAHQVLVNDLQRSGLGLALAHVAVRLLTTSDVVHVDGPRSVESAFTMDEARALAERAGLHGAIVRWRWPFRYLLTWSRA